MQKHEITKVRRDVVRRELTLVSRHQLTPHMLRLVFHSDQLAGFDSPSPDDHIKIFLPGTDGAKPTMRDYTPRAWDVNAGTVTLEFALHEAGPATEWARSAQIGDTLQIGGPRGSTVVPDDFDWYLLIGDGSALPSFSRRLESFRAGVPVTVLALVTGPDDHQPLPTLAQAQLQWLYGGADSEADAKTFLNVLQQLPPHPGDGFIWIAAEAAVSRQLYQYLTEERRHPKEWIKAAAYWTRGEAES